MDKQVRLEELELGMVIHCPTKENEKALFEALAKLGYKWGNGASLLDGDDLGRYFFRDSVSYRINENKKITFASKEKYITSGFTVIEFENVILPEE